MLKKWKGTVSHIEIYVSDLQRSLDFWGWLLTYLGYELYQQWDQGSSWIKDDTYIVLVQTAEKYLEYPYHRCHTGLNHLAFYADSKEEIDDLTKELQRRGITLLYPERHPRAGGDDSYAVFFEDPDRIKLEFVLRSDPEPKSEE